LYSTLKSYRTETNVALEQLSMTLEVVESEENNHSRVTNSSGSGWKLSKHIREKILRLSSLYDKDMEILENDLFLPFPVVHALPDSVMTSPLSGIDSDGDITSTPNTEAKFTWWSEKNTQTLTSRVETYDSIRQVIAHLVRDWSFSEGAPIRESIYRWCIEQLYLYQYVPKNGPILVPGAGLGRLAWEISRTLHCSVEAIESSICMTAVAHRILNVKRKNAFVLHPFAADSFSNEIDDEARYDAIYFPDVNPSIDAGSLSYTVGTFGYDSMQHCSKQYGAVVTSFFIDTATTVYDFITTIAMILSSGGLWVNVGPLQWHINNKVPVAVNELRMILENFRDQTSGKHVFHILHWSVDENPIRYRNHGGRRRSTYYDGYCPLRFVVRRNAT
jgi:N2227-like protein